MRAVRVSALMALAGGASCHRRPPPAPVAADAPAPGFIAVSAAPDAPPSAPDDLVPGPFNAFGLALPSGARERFATADTKMFLVEASMPRVMRYLEQRLEVHASEIHPLAALIRGASVRDARTGFVLDLGVRDEGERTLVTIWNRTPPESHGAEPLTREQALRAAGIDPATGRVAPEQNH